MKCPCNQEALPYSKCCGLYISGKKKVELPVQLMRSRYTAFVKNELNYLAATQTMYFDVAAYRSLDWICLEIIEANKPSQSALIASVTFKAYYRSENEIMCLHEKSVFQKISGSWLYIAGN